MYSKTIAIKVLFRVNICWTHFVAQFKILNRWNCMLCYDETVRLFCSGGVFYGLCGLRRVVSGLLGLCVAVCHPRPPLETLLRLPQDALQVQTRYPSCHARLYKFGSFIQLTTINSVKRQNVTKANYYPWPCVLVCERHWISDSFQTVIPGQTVMFELGCWN